MIFKIKILSLLVFPGKIQLRFALFAYFWQETERFHKSKGQNQNLTYPISPTQFLVNFLQNNFVPPLSSFVAIDHKGYFRKILTQIFKFGCFSWYHTYIFDKISLIS